MSTPFVGVVCATLISVAATPAAAVTVSAMTEFGLQDAIGVDVIGDDGARESVDPETALRLLSDDPLDPAEEDLSLAGPEAEQVGLGFTVTRASRRGTATNLLDREIEALIFFTAGVTTSIALDGPGEAGRAGGAATVDVAGEEVAAFGFESTLDQDDPACPSLPCDLELIIFNDGDNPFEEVGFVVRLAPGETVPFRVTTSAVAVAPVPLPAVAPAAALALGALAWAGRRRRA